MALVQVVNYLTDHWLDFLLGLIPLSLAYLVLNRYRFGISHFPGPVVAAHTDLWRLWMVLQGDAHIAHKKLHHQYGPVVRLGPNSLSFAQPEAIYDIYSGKKGFRKSAFYPVQQGIRAGRSLATIFSTTDEVFHAQLRRGASNAYALTTLLQFEPFVDSTTRVLLQQIDSRWADQGGPEGSCDFARWLQYYAFDVICELTYSKRMGFLEQGKDVGGLIQTISQGLKYAGPIGQFPSFDRLLRKNPIKLFLGRLGLLETTLPHVQFGAERLRERQAVMTPESLQKVDTDSTRPLDFLNRFLQAHHVAQQITEQQIFSLAQANINAGSDTTAISLRAIFYFVLKTPGVYEKLMNEIDAREGEGFFADNTTGLVAWSEAQKMPYLDAIIKEALRIFPAVGLALERVVPDEGAIIAGHHIPGGTIVGCNPWIINYDQSVYGPDADRFRPERWLEADESQLSWMKKYFFTFGMGSHTCIGKNISYLEMYKVVTAVFRRFHVNLVEPEKEWSCFNSWFVFQTGLHVRFRRRQLLSSPPVAKGE